MAKDLAALINHQRGMRAVLTRTGDYYLTLRKRVEIARKARADLFVSIHADSYRDPHVSGSSVYVLSEHGASSVHARWLAQNENAADLIGGVSLDDKSNVLASVLLDLSQTGAIESSINLARRVLHGLSDIGRIHRDRVESAAFAVLKAPDIPSILVETAYISNPKEEKLLRSHSHQEQIARAIFDGVSSYLAVKAPPGTLLAARKHVIARGDTLSGIAQEYQVSVQSIRDVNGLDGNLIHTGEVLTIPDSSGS
jgi:N-acetylmuramoyl-L-alanine amidase